MRLILEKSQIISFKSYFQQFNYPLFLFENVFGIWHYSDSYID